MLIELICNSCNKPLINNLSYIGHCNHIFCDECLYVDNYCVLCTENTIFVEISDTLYKILSNPIKTDFNQIYIVQVNSLIKQNEYLQMKIEQYKQLLNEAKIELENKEETNVTETNKAIFSSRTFHYKRKK